MTPRQALMGIITDAVESILRWSNDNKEPIGSDQIAETVMEALDNSGYIVEVENG